MKSTTQMSERGEMKLIFSNDYSLEERNNYLRFLIKLLHKKYFVAQAPIAKELGLNPNYFRDFTNSVRNVSEERLNLIEGYVTDLFAGILEDEIPQDEEDFDSFIKSLSNSLIFKELVR